MNDDRYRKLKEKFKLWRKDPVQFVRDNFKVEPDHWQKEALIAFGSGDADKQRISLQACAGVGKSAVLAWCGWNFLSCYGEKGEHPKAAAVSITYDNLKANLWAEFAKWQSLSDLLIDQFEWTKERIFAKQFPETWFMTARSWSKSANADEQGRTLSGMHSKYILFLLDESGDIPQSVLKTGEQALSGCNFGKIVQAGNPTSYSGILYQAATTLRAMWHVICITGDPDDPRRSSRVDIEWAREQIKVYGRDNPWVMSYILGQFPDVGFNTLLSPDEVYAAMHRHVKITDYDSSQKRLGIDVARFGDDLTIIFPRQGLMAHKYVEMRNARTNDIAARVAQAKAKWKSELELVDGTGGYGAGVIDSLIQAGHAPMEIHFSGKPIDPRYLNKRAEMWFDMVAWVKRGGSLPDDSQLAKELTTPTYTFRNGKFALEDKDMIKKRLGYSCDRADALALTFALPEMPANNTLEALLTNNNNKLLWDYNPIDRES